MTSVIPEVSTAAPLPEDQRPTAASPLTSTPLSQLFAEHNVTVVESQITDPTFFGNALAFRDGRIVLSMPSGRSEYERDTMARYLLSVVLDVPLPPLPSALAVAKFGRAA